MLRLFVAVPLPETTRSDLAGLCSGVPGARWVPSENMHLTLRFIGEVGRGDADDIHQALGRISLPAFDLTVAGVGCFESGNKIHTLWANVEKQELLARLREKVEAAVVRVGLEPERRKFKAHVTLARFRRGSASRVGTFIEHQDRFRSGPFRVECFTLFRSHLGGEGPHYEPLADYPLG
jgi:2'-5' RNA ligase